MKSSSAIALLSLASIASSLPKDAPQEQHAKRQAGDYSALLALASQAGIAVPTDNPALLLSIAPLAASLNSLLPTAPVLSALETAAPSGLISSLVHDPSFAASWISSFEQGPSPSWFLALPTSVRSYLHTYADNGNLAAAATAAAGIQSIENSVISQASVSSSLASVNSSTTSASVIGSNGTITGTGGTSSSATTGALSSLRSTASAVTSSLSTAGAPRETGVLAAGAAAMVGILGLAVAL